MPKPKDTGLGSSGYDTDFYKVEKRPGKPDRLILDENAYRKQYGYKNPRDRYANVFVKQFNAKHSDDAFTPTEKRWKDAFNLRHYIDSELIHPAEMGLRQDEARALRMQRRFDLKAPALNDRGSNKPPVRSEAELSAAIRDGWNTPLSRLRQSGFYEFLDYKFPVSKQPVAKRTIGSILREQMMKQQPRNK